ILYMGKAHQHKGLAELLDALANVREDFRLVAITKGAILEKLKEKVASYASLAGKVEFKNFVPPWQVPELLRAADLYVQLENRFPVPIHTPKQSYEALLCGTPVVFSEEMAHKISSALPDVREKFPVIDDPRDTKKFTELISKTLKRLAPLEKEARVAE